jgi:hypothetical protein
MKLKEMKVEGRDSARYTSSLTDLQGSKDYEFTITGPRSLVSKMFSESEFEFLIDTKVSRPDSDNRFKEIWLKYSQTVREAAPAEDAKILEKSVPRKAVAKNSVIVSLRRVRGQGTFWMIGIPQLAIPMGLNVFFVLPPVCNCAGSVFPAAGDPDLFLTLNGVTTPTVGASTKGGLAIDSVAFGSSICWPWMEFSPFFRVFGFKSSVAACLFSGFGVFP